jgi:hypothetical protein
MNVDKAYLVGVFPIIFRTRSDIAIAVAALHSIDEPSYNSFIIMLGSLCGLKKSI